MMMTGVAPAAYNQMLIRGVAAAAAAASAAAAAAAASSTAAACRIVIIAAAEIWLFGGIRVAPFERILASRIDGLCAEAIQPLLTAYILSCGVIDECKLE